MSQPQSIGRFRILRLLGQGAQGSVYLAEDPRLERQVAIKTLLKGEPQQNEALLKEARIVSKLQHPHLVTLYDAGEQDGAPYLVYAFVEGETLAQLLQREKQLPLARAVQIMIGVLEGIAHAHAQGVLHLDLKPGNVMIAANGQPLVMDFGIARSIAHDAPQDKALAGTPHYLAPELIAGEAPTQRADLYALGMVLYRMVAGSTAVDGASVYEILHRTANEATAAPSSKNIHIDERLEVIILKALARNPQERYPSADAMREALQQYLEPEAETMPGRDDSHSTLEFLLRRMRSKSDFPALSSTISDINRIVASDSASANKLTKAILQDFALTNKLLKLVNTASFGQFGGKINTISKAVVILGFETIRNIAMTLILLEFLQNKAQASQLKDEVISSFFTGLLAMQLSAGRNVRDGEEAMICAMFQNLGRLLATFYFFEESQEVARQMEQGLSESQASQKVLGITYNDLGIGVVKTWNFPERLQVGMQRLSGDKIRKPRDELDQLTVTVNLANDLCAIAASTPLKEKEAALDKLIARYSETGNVSQQQLGKALDSGLKEIGVRALVLNLPTASSPVLKTISQWSGQEAAPEPPPPPDESLEGVTSLDLIAEESAEPETAKVDPEAVLSAGIQDVTNTLVSDFALNDVLQMVLEAMYRGMGFHHVMILVRDGKSNSMRARHGFGEQVDVLLPKFQFSLKFEPNVFHVALQKGADIVIEDVNAENITSKIPQWYHQGVDAQCFLLLPVMINAKPIGLFYADMRDANSLQITARQLGLLRTLRNQAVLAIKQKQLAGGQ